jgi:hypothetical protein
VRIIENVRALGACALLTASMSACGFPISHDLDESSSAETSSSLTQRLGAIDVDLARGAKGSGVRAVQEYLTTFGYLPNETLANAYPAWRPLVASHATAGVYDAPTAEAVRHLQTNAGLAETGIVDAATRNLLLTPRCGVPDGIARIDPSEKFALQTGVPFFAPGATVTWKLVLAGGTCPKVPAQPPQFPIGSAAPSNTVSCIPACPSGQPNCVHDAAVAALATWAQQTSLTFVEVTGTPQIQIQFISLWDLNPTRWDGANGTLASTNVVTANVPFPTWYVNLDTAENWSTVTPTPAGKLDLRTVMTHELGHALGLAHSSLPAAKMYPFISGTNRTLDVDDDVAISSLYDQWEQLPGTATDIGANGAGDAWIIGTNPVYGGYGVYKWNGSSGWSPSDGGGVRIAVEASGIPWLVNDAGNIFRRNSSSVGTGGWTQKPGTANDIGIGSDGSVWIVGTNAVAGGYGIYKWDASSSSWVQSNGGAVRIAVDATGVPWVVNDAGNIYVRSTSSATSGFWAQIPYLPPGNGCPQPAPGTGKDIGIGIGNYAWLIGTNSVDGGYGIYVWDGQTGGPSDAPCENQWLSVPGGATQISVGSFGRPWVVNSAGNILRSTK